MPPQKLYTAAGVDHDYNFISSIERGIERSDKRIVEEKRLVDQKELKEILKKEDLRRRHNWRAPRKPDTPLEKAIDRAAVMVDRAPKGMTRSRENKTSWNKPFQCINWRIELVDESCSTSLHFMRDNQQIGEAYEDILEEQARANMTAEERAAAKKRRLKEHKKEVKRARVTHSTEPLAHTSFMQDPSTTAWNMEVPASQTETNLDIEAPPDPDTILSIPYDSYEPSSGKYFYLHKPHTPSSLPKVLIPIHHTGTLSIFLRNQVVLEYPTIYVLPYAPIALPKAYILEREYLNPSKSQKQKAVHDVKSSGKGNGLVDYGSDSDTSSSGSEMEDGEIV
jgi:hypothetical protein